MADESPERTGDGKDGMDTAEQAEASRAAYDASRYERPSVTTDVVILAPRDGRLVVLLVRRRHWPYAGLWAIPGGFVEPGESVAEGARRELAEETGLRDVAIHQLHTFGEPDRDPRTRVISVAHYALVRAEDVRARAGDDAAEVGWFPLADPPPLAFDHARILACARTRLAHAAYCAPVAAAILPPAFTLAALRDTYAALLGTLPVDDGILLQRLLANGVIERAGAHPAGAPAHYRFVVPVG